jgi:cytochrome P450
MSLTESLAAFDPLAPGFLADPYPDFAEYRRNAPVFYSPELDYWVVSRYADVRNALRDTTAYSAANTLSPIQPPVCREAGLIPNAIEEVLRFDSPVITWRRKTKVALRIQDVDIPAETNLLLLIGSANRDESVFEAAESFDIQRPNARDHLSFGMGNHFCLGAPLARLEARVVLEELTRRRPGLQLIDGQTLAFHPNIAFRGPTSLRTALP